MVGALANTQFSKFPRSSPSLAQFFFNLPMIRYRPNLSAQKLPVTKPLVSLTFIGHFYDRIELENPLSFYTEATLCDVLRETLCLYDTWGKTCHGHNRNVTVFKASKCCSESADSCRTKLFVYCLPTPKVVVCCLSHQIAYRFFSYFHCWCFAVELLFPDSFITVWPRGVKYLIFF